MPDRRSIALASAGLGMLLLAGCNGGGGKAGDSGAAGAGAEAGATKAAAKGAPVKLALVERRDIARQLDVTGSLVALEDVLLGNRTAGRLVWVGPREGEMVTRGQVVAEMDRVATEAQAASARSGLASAQSRAQQAGIQLEQARNMLRQAETNLAMTEKTTATGVAVAQSGLESAEQRLSVVRQGARPQERRQAEAQLSAAQANLDKARADLSRTKDLYGRQAISKSQLDQVQASHDAAQAQFDVAREALSLVREGARREDVRQAELAVKQAQDGLAKANADRDLVSVRRADVQNARSSVRVAESNVEGARLAVEQARASVVVATDAMVSTKVISTVSGFVSARVAEPGQQLGNGMGILRVVNPGSVYFQASLSESQYAEVRPGQIVDLTIDALPGRRLSGRVTRILPVASAASRSFTVRIDFRTDATMRPQMFARGRILVGSHAGVMTIPKDAVVFDPVTGAARAFVESAGKAVARTLSLGYTNPERVEVISGLRDGDRVIVAGQSALQDGDEVAP